jgi:hypothetical protein
MGVRLLPGAQCIDNKFSMAIIIVEGVRDFVKNKIPKGHLDLIKEV